MPVNGYFDTVFALSGDKTAVPDPTQGSGAVSYTQGFGNLYSTPVGSGGLNFPRAQFNQLMFDVTTALQYFQQNGAPPFITSVMNGGSPFSYAKGAIVSYNPGGGVQNYVSLAASNTTNPTNPSWQPLGTSVSPLFTGGTSGGSANVQTVTTSRGGFANTAGNILTMKAGFSNTGSITVNPDAAGNLPVKKDSQSGLVNLVSGDVIVGQEYMFISDGTNLQLLNPTPVSLTARQVLTTNTTFYVATTGNDSNPGTIGSPWLTLQHAYNYIASNVDIAGFTCTVEVAAGTYSAGVVASIPSVGGFVTFQGDLVTPDNCIISSGSGACFWAFDNCQINIGGFKVTGTSYLVFARGAGAKILINGAMDYGAGGTTLLAHINADWTGFVEITHDYTISGGAGQHYYATGSGVIQMGLLTVTLTGTPAFAGQFALATSNGTLQVFGNTYTGAATGVRYLVDTNATIGTNGGGASFLPGNSAGSVTNGGQYT